MKYSTVAIVALAQGIVAMPWSVAQHDHSESKFTSTNEDITLSVKVSQSPLRKGTPTANSFAICWLLCASEQVRCPDGWYAKQMGDCWTCCKDPE
ncbi:hypothetical protein F66182_1372 [Fusarium sp. NRRL 66182]|nr:hypothetical protein F66182_1372 [Fusarium sp. NRRL 66182]